MWKDAANGGLKHTKKGKVYIMKTRKVFIAVLFLAMWVAVLVIPMLNTNLQPLRQAEAQQTVFFPSVFANVGAGASVGTTGGTVNNGGHAVTVAASSVAVTVSKADCTSPNYANCNFVVANSAGTVSATTSLQTAFAAGNTLLAYVETSATLVTNVVFPQQSNIPYAGALPALMDCGTTATCATATLIEGMATKVAMGTATAVGGTVTVTGLSFGSGATFGCAVSISGATSTANVASYQIISGASIAIKENNNGADTVHYNCFGY